MRASNTLIFLTCLLPTMAFSASTTAEGPPYDDGFIPFFSDWCASSTPEGSQAEDVFDQSMFKEICYGSVVLEGDMLFPGVRVKFTNNRNLTIGCMGAWTELEPDLLARECVNAWGERRTIVLYEKLDPRRRSVSAVWALIPGGPHMYVRKPRG